MCGAQSRQEPQRLRAALRTRASQCPVLRAEPGAGKQTVATWAQLTRGGRAADLSGEGVALQREVASVDLGPGPSRLNLASSLVSRG